jgi:hypothetical protein
MYLFMYLINKEIELIKLFLIFFILPLIKKTQIKNTENQKINKEIELIKLNFISVMLFLIKKT